MRKDAKQGRVNNKDTTGKIRKKNAAKPMSENFYPPNLVAAADNAVVCRRAECRIEEVYNITCAFNREVVERVNFVCFVNYTERRTCFFALRYIYYRTADVFVAALDID